jgi:hypothetical protein
VMGWSPQPGGTADGRLPAVCAGGRAGLVAAAAGRAAGRDLHASEQDRPGVACRRARWKKYHGRIDPSRLVFIDEACARTNMTRIHGRVPRGAA